MKTYSYPDLSNLKQRHDFQLNEGDKLYLQYTSDEKRINIDGFSSVGIWLEHEGKFEMRWMASWIEGLLGDKTLVLSSMDEAETVYEGDDPSDNIFDSAEEASNYGFGTNLVAYN